MVTRMIFSKVVWLGAPPKRKIRRALAARDPVRRTLVAAMILGMLLAGGLALEGPAVAQTQSPEQQDGAQTTPDQPSGPDLSSESPNFSRLLRKAEQEGSVQVIVGLRTDFVPEGRLNSTRVADQRDGIDDTRAELQADLVGTGYRTLREYNTVPYVALTVPPQAFRALQRSPHVASITEDLEFSPTLAQSTETIQAPTMWERGYTGDGQTIAVLESLATSFC